MRIGTRRRVGSSRWNLPSWITMPIDQKECNACWAISTCQVISDRLRRSGKISLEDQLNFYVFHDYMTSTDPSLGGCSMGAYPDTGMNESIDTGAPLMSQSKDRVFDDRVFRKDLDAPHYKVRGWRRLYTPQQIKQELDSQGAVTAIINLYDSFYNFMGSGIYQPLPNERSDPNNMHMISIVGYDDSDGTFIIRNSYGYNWGNNGFAKILQNDNKLSTLGYVWAPIM